MQIMTTGNAVDFGDMTIVSNHLLVVQRSRRVIMSEFRIDQIKSQDAARDQMLQVSPSLDLLVL